MRRHKMRKTPTSARSKLLIRKRIVFVFKIQANMDLNHRDRIASARLCSGKLTRGMSAKFLQYRCEHEPLIASVFFCAGPRHRR